MDPQKSSILIFPQDPLLKNYLKAFLTYLGYPYFCSDREDETLTKIKELIPALVMLDAIPSELQWLEFEKVLRELKPRPAVLLLTDSKGTTLERKLKNGKGIYYVRRPFDPKELVEMVQRFLGKVQCVPAEEEDIEKRIGISTAADERSASLPILGISKQLNEILAIADRLVTTDTTVMIRGESGTGKELIARRIHERSVRRDKPFIKVLCPAIPDALLESELFGYEKGSFTGAMRRKPGRFEFAHEGTIFLDEIGDIPFSLQSKLLQVLQEGEFARIGGKADIRVDVRIIAATNKDLEKAVREGSFREDLFYRLNVVNIYMPPLRDRKEDIPILVRFFLERLNRQFNKSVELSHDSMRLFMEYHWPGNVRELENTLKGMVIVGNEKEVLHQLRSKIDSHRSSLEVLSQRNATTSSTTATSFPNNRRKYERRQDRLTTHFVGVPNGDSTSLKAISRDAARMAEQDLIRRILDQTHWNRKKAANILGISYKALLYKIKYFHNTTTPSI
jgi:two-component system, NtrC family, response regulator AtoC